MLARWIVVTQTCHIHKHVHQKQQVGALLAMLRQRGETPVEIAGMVRAMLKQRFPVNVRTWLFLLLFVYDIDCAAAA